MTPVANPANKILIRGLRLEMNIGIFDHEKGRLQPVLVDVDIHLDGDIRWHKDDIRETVSYDDLASRIEKISALKHYNLLETFAEDMAANILQISKIKSVRIAVSKPGIMQSAESAAVEIIRLRS